MTFFELPPRSEHEPPPEPRQPPWLGPPDNVLGVPVGIDPLVFRSEAAAVVVGGFVAYPTGVEFRVAMRVRVAEPELFPFEWPPRRTVPRSTGPAGSLPEDLLRLGLLFADGRKVTTLGVQLPHDEAEPSGPLLVPRGGGGGGHTWEQGMWLWPLPPPGPLVVVVEWPARGLGETRAERDAEALVEAADRAVELWPDDRPDPPPMGGHGYLAT